MAVKTGRLLGDSQQNPQPALPPSDPQSAIAPIPPAHPLSEIQNSRTPGAGRFAESPVRLKKLKRAQSRLSCEWPDSVRRDERSHSNGLEHGDSRGHQKLANVIAPEAGGRKFPSLQIRPAIPPAIRNPISKRRGFMRPLYLYPALHPIQNPKPPHNSLLNVGRQQLENVTERQKLDNVRLPFTCDNIYGIGVKAAM